MLFSWLFNDLFKSWNKIEFFFIIIGLVYLE